VGAEAAHERRWSVKNIVDKVSLLGDGSGFGFSYFGSTLPAATS
jgi:hypothetical protein